MPPVPKVLSIVAGALLLGYLLLRAIALKPDASVERVALLSPATRMTPRLLASEPPFGPLYVEGSGLPCDVDAVLASRCRRCHATPARHGAPFRLFTWEETQVLRHGEPLYVKLGEVVTTGFMPNRVATEPPVERLTPEEKRILLDWVAAGAPRGSCEPIWTP